MLIRGFSPSQFTNVRKFLEQTIYFALAGKLTDPIHWNGFKSISNTRQTARHAAGRVTVTTEVDSFEHTILKITRREQAPEACMECMEHITTGGYAAFWKSFQVVL